MDERISIEFTANEVNKVLQSLGKQPYEEVSALIGRIHSQCGTLLCTGTNDDPAPDQPAASELAE